MSSLIFSTDKEKQIFLIKKKHMHSVLLYNLQQIQNKRRKRYSQVQQTTNAVSFSNLDALKLLLQENRQKERKRIQQKRLLRESYQRQIKDKQEKQKRQRIDDRLHFQQQMQQSEYQETVRIKQLSKMFNKVSYQGIPVAENKRSKTMSTQLQKPYRKPSFLPILPQNNQKQHYIRTQKSQQQLQKSVISQNKQIIRKRSQQKLKLQSLPPIRINSPLDQ